jgi:parvulin-like peptidyl-prolyl isomerase
MSVSKEKMSATFKSMMKIAAPSLLMLIFAGFSFAQTSGKTPDARAKGRAAAPSSAATPSVQSGKEDEIPRAEPNAIFPAVVARVNGKPIPGGDLEKAIRRELSSIGSPGWKDLREEYRNELTQRGLTALINASLLYQKALASGLKATDAEVQAEMQRIAKTYKSDAEMNAALAKQLMNRESLQKSLHQTLTVAKLVDETITRKTSVTPEEAAKYYTNHTKEFHHPELVRSSHILIPGGETAEQAAQAKQRAESILARLKKGEDFGKLAKEVSTDLSASRGGDIGYNSRDALSPEYGEAAFSTSVGGIKLIEGEYGYHIIKVTDRKKEGLSTLEEVKPQLTQFLTNEKVRANLSKLIGQLRDQAKIEILIPAGQALNR